MAGLLSRFVRKISYQPVIKHDEGQCRDSDSFASSDEGLISHEPKSTEVLNSRTWTYLGLLAHLFVLIAYTITYAILVRRGVIAAKSCGHVIYSPAHEAVMKEPVEFQGHLKIVSPYGGPPSPEVDRAWKELLQYSNIRVSGEELRRVNKTSIRIPGEEDGYWAELSVVHELHCIKRLRHFWFSDYYFPNITAEERRLNWLHNDHCLEILRQAAMCHADVSMVTFHWKPTSVFPSADFQNIHECANWDSLYEWQKERSVDLMKPGFLVHPQLGAPFPEGRYDGIGAAESTQAADSKDELSAMGLRDSSRRMWRVPVDEEA